MKYLSHYVEESTTEALNKFGAFFAFSDKQFKESMKPGVKYTSVGTGLIAPTSEVSNLKHALDVAYNNGVMQDLKENGVKAIIHRELANYECGYTSDYSDALASLRPYGITRKEIDNEWSEYLDNCNF